MSTVHPIADVSFDPRSSVAGKAQQAFLHGANLTGHRNALALYMARGPILEVHIERRAIFGLYL